MVLLLLDILIIPCILIFPFGMVRILILYRHTIVVSLLISGQDGNVIHVAINLKKTVYRDVYSVNELEGIASSSVL